jgi:hypothetical protein
MDKERFLSSSTTTTIIIPTITTKNETFKYNTGNIFFKDGIYCKRSKEKSVNSVSGKKILTEYTLTPVIYITDIVIMTGLTFYINTSNKDFETEKSICDVELAILKLYSSLNTTCYNKLQCAYVKEDIHSNDACSINDALHVIGVWETEDAFGLEYTWIKRENILSVSCETCQ